MAVARVDTHSRVVAWLKIVLPLAALALLSTLFLFGGRIDPEAALPYAKVDVKERAREPRMTAPTYAGVTSDGGSLTVTAAEVRPATGATNGAAKTVVAVLETPDGARTDMKAATAVLNSADKTVLMSGGVETVTSSGYHITTPGLTAKLDRSGLESTGQVTATGPAGNLVADSMVLSQDDQTPGAYVLVFKGSVKLIYHPGGAAAD